ncbi:MAG: hypothetical protein V3R37_07700, partial [Rhodospirillales bacterium]
MMGGRFLFGLLACLSLLAGLAAWLAPEFAAAESSAIEAVPVPLNAEVPDQDTIGRLRYRGGL